MTRNEIYTYGLIVRGLIEAMGMVAENENDKFMATCPTFTHKDFIEVADKYGIHHNALITNMEDK